MKYIIVIVLGLFLANPLSAQNISGYVCSSDGQPLAGASILVKEISKGTYTLNNGTFELQNIPTGNYTLEVSYVGYKKRSVKITVPWNNGLLKLILTEDAITTRQVIVTATKNEEDISSLPVSAMAIYPIEMEKKNRLTLDEELRYIPGINMNLDQISIRGSSGYSKGAGTRVLTAIDGVPIYTGDTGEIVWEMLPTSNIDRIEIIKGPASSLYGSTAIGGVINIITKEIYDKPVTGFSTYAGIYSDPYYSQWKWSSSPRTFYGIGINHSNTIGRFGYSLSLKKLDNAGYRENDFSKRILGSLKLNYRFDSSNTISGFASYLNMNRGNFLYWKDGADALIPKDEDNGKTVKSDRWFGSIIYKHIFSRFVSAELKSSIYNTNFEGIGVEVTTSKSNLVRNELLLHTALSSSFMLTSGVEYAFSSITSNIFSSKNFYSAAVYSQAEYKGIERIILSAGFRYDYIKLDSVSGAGALSPKAGINYKISDNLILRASAGAGFRAPTPAEVFTSTGVGGIQIKENPDLTFEKSFSVDAGAVITVNENINFDFSLFYNGYENFIEPVLLKTGYIQFINLPKAKIEGFEINNGNKFIDGLITTKIGYTYLWSRDIENNAPMKYRPRNSVYASVSFSPSPFEFNIDFRYMSRVDRIDDDLTRPPLTLIPDGEERVDVYVTDISAGWGFSAGMIPVKLYFNCKNLFNYNYVEFIGNLAPIRSYSLSLDLYF